MSFIKNIALKFFHLSVALHYAYAIYYDCVYVLPEEVILRQYSFGGKLVYLTVINAVKNLVEVNLFTKHYVSNFFFNQILQSFYFLLAFLNDIFGSNEYAIKEHQRIRKFKDYFFATFIFPLALSVAILFWLLYAVDRTTVFPKEAESFFPSWLNHILHTNVAVFAIIEMIILHHQCPSRKEGITGLVTFMFSYLIWMFITKYYAGRFAYPIIDALNVPGKIGFFVFTMSFPMGMYLLGEFVNRKIWSDTRLLKMYQKNEIKGRNF